VEDKTNFPTSLDQALATAFTYNPANPNMAAWASTSALAQVPPVAGGSTRWLPKETRVETSNSASVEVTIASPTKCDRTHVRAQAASTPNNGHANVAASDVV
jgi:hypothetical protein